MQEPIWAEIDLEAIAHNVTALKRIASPRAELCAVVKANAYGHGAVPVAKVALQNGASYLAVARLGEGLTLRRAGITAPILILGYTVPDQFGLVVDHELTQTIYSLEMARKLAIAAQARGKTAKIHLKIDSGMGRLGFIAGDSQGIKDILSIASLNNLELEGIFTHFATADQRDRSYAREQFERFRQTLKILAERGLTFRYRHAANSAATINLPETHLDLVRPGLAIYGDYPSEDREAERRRIDLKPAMTIKARVAHVKRVTAGTGVSYGITYRTARETTLVTLPVGYADGYSRLLSSRGQVLLRGKRLPVAGRVCMDQLIVDAGDLPVETGEEAVLLGSQGGETISVDEMAALLGTISNEVFCMVAARVPRIYVGETVSARAR